MSRRKRNYPTVDEVDPTVAIQDGSPLAVEARQEPSQDEPATPVAEIDPMPSVAFPVAFERSLLKVLRHEGGYVDHPRDPGGATNLGISLRYAVTRGSLFDLDKDGDVDAADIRLITPETAAPAYFEDFWLKVRADELPPGLDHIVFDAAVNSGPGRSIRWMQTAVGAVADGAFGPATLRAVQHAVGRDGVIPVIERAVSNRLAFLRTLDWITFGRGWQRRVEGVLQEGHKIALGLPL
jgi:lysozyme family protein